jgi:hypothetical protein
MFDNWDVGAEYPTLFRVNRRVMVDMQATLPGLGRRMDGVPLWCRGAGLRLEPCMPGRQIAWGASDGGFFAVVEVAAGSANGRSQLTMQLWCEPTMITTDVAGLEHFAREPDSR